MTTLFSIGEAIGPYVIRRELGKGGMGAVYLAEHRHIERLAAIKVLLPELSSRQDVVARFFAEARATSRICHPGIVEVLDCDVHASGRAYIVMEYLAGATLRDTIQQNGGGLDVATSLRITAEMADALAAAHDKGIIHRDLKPDNIFLASAGPDASPVVKILDFGVAKLIEHGDVSTTKTGSLLGTPLYMSPEQCRGATLAETRSDIYSLGCIVFEMLAGRPPFVSDGIGELFMAHMTERPPDLSEAARVYVPPSVCALVSRMLEKQPAARPGSMRDIVVAVGAVAAELGGVPLRLPHTLMMEGSKASPAAPIPVSEGRSRALSAPIVGHTRALPPQKSAREPSDAARDEKYGSVTTLSRFATELEAAGVRRRPRALTIGAVLAGVGLLSFAALKLLGTRDAGMVAPVVTAAAPARAAAPLAEIPASAPVTVPSGAVHTRIVLPEADDAPPATPPAREGPPAAPPAAPETADAPPPGDGAHAEVTPSEGTHHHASHHSHSHPHGAPADTSPAARPPAPAPARGPSAKYRALDDD